MKALQPWVQDLFHYHCETKGVSERQSSSNRGDYRHALPFHICSTEQMKSAGYRLRIDVTNLRTSLKSHCLSSAVRIRISIKARASRTADGVASLKGIVFAVPPTYYSNIEYNQNKRGNTLHYMVHHLGRCQLKSNSVHYTHNFEKSNSSVMTRDL
jgi:hypothetical protein